LEKLKKYQGGYIVRLHVILGGVRVLLNFKVGSFRQVGKYFWVTFFEASEQES